LKYTILIVEDNPKNLKLFKDILTYYGHETHEALDGVSAVESACLMQPDAVVMDVQLDKMDGFAVAEELRKRPATASIPLIAVTAYAMTGDEKRFRDAGFSGYLTKPINTRTFASEIEKIIEQSGGGAPINN